MNCFPCKKPQQFALRPTRRRAFIIVFLISIVLSILPLLKTHSNSALSLSSNRHHKRQQQNLVQATTPQLTTHLQALRDRAIVNALADLKPAGEAEKQKFKLAFNKKRTERFFLCHADASTMTALKVALGHRVNCISTTVYFTPVVTDKSSRKRQYGNVWYFRNMYCTDHDVGDDCAYTDPTEYLAFVGRHWPNDVLHMRFIMSSTTDDLSHEALKRSLHFLCYLLRYDLYGRDFRGTVVVTVLDESGAEFLVHVRNEWDVWRSKCAWCREMIFGIESSTWNSGVKRLRERFVSGNIIVFSNPTRSDISPNVFAEDTGFIGIQGLKDAVDDPIDMDKYLHWGVSWLFTHRPDLLKPILFKYNQTLGSSPGGIHSSHPVFIKSDGSNWFNDRFCTCKYVTLKDSSSSMKGEKRTGCVISVPPPRDYACMCKKNDEQRSCRGSLVVCWKWNDGYCLVPDTSWGTCQYGGGDCLYNYWYGVSDCECEYIKSGCRIKRAGPSPSACKCVIDHAMRTCHGELMWCPNINNQLCDYPNNTLAACHYAGGNCKGYLAMG